MKSLANIGPADIYQQLSSKRARGRLSSWLPLPLSRKREDGYETVNRKTDKERETDCSVEKHEQDTGPAEVPVLALSYWVEGEPR